MDPITSKRWLLLQKNEILRVILQTNLHYIMTWNPTNRLHLVSFSCHDFSNQKASLIHKKKTLKKKRKKKIHARLKKAEVQQPHYTRWYTLIASPTICGERNNPWKNVRIMSPGVEPQSTPSPGAERRAAAASTHLLFPATYPPHGAMVPPGFFIKLPATRSAPCAQLCLISLLKKKHVQKIWESVTHDHRRFYVLCKFTIAVIHHDQTVWILCLHTYAW